MRSVGEITIFVTFLSVSVLGYSGGPPKEACLSMNPDGHGVEPQITNSYHHLQIWKEIHNFKLGEKLPISLFVTSERPGFKGFFIQARNDDDKIVGHFETNDPNVKLMDCDAIESGAISHVNPLKKHMINATWVAPNDQELVKNGVKFFYTVVEEKERFWTKQSSYIIEYSSSVANLKSAYAMVFGSICLMKLLF